MDQAKRLSGEGAVLVQVHLWTSGAGAGAASGAEGAEVPPPALAMVADLLQVRGGELRDAGAGSIAASFGDPVVAVNAARNLQRLVLGFARAWEGGALGGCTTLRRVDEAGDGIDVGSLRDNAALKQIHPGQVVLLGSLCEAARSIPGLEFRPIAGVALGPAGKNGSARQALQLLAPLRMEGYVEEPFELKAVVREAAAAAEVPAQPAEPAVTSRPPAYVLTSSPASGKSAAAPASGSMSTVPFGATRAVAPVASAGDEIGAFAREEKGSGSGFSRWAILGGLGAVAVAGVLIFTPVLKKTPHPAAAPAQPPAEPAATIPAPAAGAGDVVPAAAAPPVVSTKGKTSDAAHGKGAPRAATAAATQQDAEAAEEPRPAHGLTFSAAEISSLIAHADRDSGNGNFDKAIQEYRLVLSREPSNDLAKRGLARALYNKEHK
jgi:hypothetical protein